MKTYRVPVEITNTNISYATVYVDNEIVDETFPSYSDTGYGFDNADEILTWFDSTINSPAWRKCGQGRVNYGATLTAIEFMRGLMNRWGSAVSFEFLDTTYSTNTTLDAHCKVDGVTTQFTAKFETNGTTNESVEILDSAYSSPFRYSIKCLGSSNSIFFTFPVLPEDAIKDGKFALTTDMVYAELNMRIYYGGSGTWQLDTYVGLRNNVPQYWINELNGKRADNDPYDGEGDSDTGGGGDSGDQDAWDDDSDRTPVPPLPSISAVDTGFITLYNPRMVELQSLASYMWSGLFDIDSFRKIMANPMDTIIGLSIVPVNVPAGAAQVVTVGNISTGISLTKAAAQYVEVNCGTVSISELRHSYLDYSPYTKISLMLPYIGSVDLDIDQLYSKNGGNLGIVYHVDILSGACIAFVTIGGDVIGQYAGQCAVSIPVTGNDFTQTIMALGTLVAKGFATGVTGGLSAPLTAASVGGAVTAAANTAVNVASSKPTFQRSGSISGGNGLLSIQKPFVILERPRLCTPGRQNSFTGYPAYITYTLSALSGFTQVQDVHLNDIPATDGELREILQLLREGVIL